jgi:hypothetical protein
MFDIQSNGSASVFEEIFPEFTDLDRVGVVVRSPYGGLGISHLIVRSYLDFYQRRRGIGEVYPDHFLFSVGGPTGDHSMLDLWPENHYVSVPNEAESILQAINDRGITRLLVETTVPSPPTFENWTYQSALGRLASTVIFDPAGQVEGANVSISASADVEEQISLQLDPEKVVRDSEGYDDFLRYYAAHRDDVDPFTTTSLRKLREASKVNGRRVETYWVATTEDALSRLVTTQG